MEVMGDASVQPDIHNVAEICVQSESQGHKHKHQIQYIHHYSPSIPYENIS